MSDIRGERDSANPTARRPRREAIVPEAGQDAYRLTVHFPEPTTCPSCGAVYRAGRWEWPQPGTPAPAGGHETVCPACRRIADAYPAGVLTLAGSFLTTHHDDVLAVLRAEERIETAEHPLHRIATVEEESGEVLVTTTDVHLPRRIAEALANAYHGEIDIAYGRENETVRVTWRRDDPHVPVPGERPPPLPLEVQTRGVIVTPEADAYLKERIESLRRFYPRIVGCRVILDAPMGHHRTGGPFQVDVYVDVPGADVRVTKQQGKDLHVAIRGAFDAVRRQLEDHIRRQRGEVSPTEGPPRGRVARLFPDRGYGFLVAADGHEIYFHRNGVIAGAFDRLQVGMEVRYAEEQGDKGPQASTVALLD